jgi:hypothetical protein
MQGMEAIEPKKRHQDFSIPLTVEEIETARQKAEQQTLDLHALMKTNRGGVVLGAGA